MLSSSAAFRMQFNSLQSCEYPVVVSTPVKFSHPGDHFLRTKILATLMFPSDFIQEFVSRVGLGRTHVSGVGQHRYQCQRHDQSSDLVRARSHCATASFVLFSAAARARCVTAYLTL